MASIVRGRGGAGRGREVARGRAGSRPHYRNAAFPPPMAKRTRSRQHEAAVPNTREEVDAGNPDLLSPLLPEMVDEVVRQFGDARPADVQATRQISRLFRDRAESPESINAHFKDLFRARFGPRPGDEAAGITLGQDMWDVADYLAREIPKRMAEAPEFPTGEMADLLSNARGHRVAPFVWVYLYAWASARVRVQTACIIALVAPGPVILGDYPTLGDAAHRSRLTDLSVWRPTSDTQKFGIRRGAATPNVDESLGCIYQQLASRGCGVIGARSATTRLVAEYKVAIECTPISLGEMPVHAAVSTLCEHWTCLEFHITRGKFEEYWDDGTRNGYDISQMFPKGMIDVATINAEGKIVLQVMPSYYDEMHEQTILSYYAVFQAKEAPGLRFAVAITEEFIMGQRTKAKTFSDFCSITRCLTIDRVEIHGMHAPQADLVRLLRLDLAPDELRSGVRVDVYDSSNLWGELYTLRKLLTLVYGRDHEVTPTLSTLNTRDGRILFTWHAMALFQQLRDAGASGASNYADLRARFIDTAIWALLLNDVTMPLYHGPSPVPRLINWQSRACDVCANPAVAYAHPETDARYCEECAKE